jgi:hypothetical protein
MNDYCTVDEFADISGLKRTTIFKLIKLGLPSIKILRHRRILTEKAKAWLMAGGADLSRLRKTRAKRE